MAPRRTFSVPSLVSIDERSEQKELKRNNLGLHHEEEDEDDYALWDLTAVEDIVKEEPSWHSSGSAGMKRATSVGSFLPMSRASQTLQSKRLPRATSSERLTQMSQNFNSSEDSDASQKPFSRLNLFRKKSVDGLAQLINRNDSGPAGCSGGLARHPSAVSLADLMQEELEAEQNKGRTNQNDSLQGSFSGGLVRHSSAVSLTDLTQESFEAEINKGRTNQNDLEPTGFSGGLARHPSAVSLTDIAQVSFEAEMKRSMSRARMDNDASDLTGFSGGLARHPSAVSLTDLMQASYR